MSNCDALRYPRDNFIIIAFTFCLSRLKIANLAERGPAHTLSLELSAIVILNCPQF